MPEVRIGVPTIVGAMRLPRRVGMQYALELPAHRRPHRRRAREGDRPRGLGRAARRAAHEARTLADRLCARARRSRCARSRRWRTAARRCRGSTRFAWARRCAASRSPPRTPPKACAPRAKGEPRNGRADDPRPPHAAARRRSSCAALVEHRRSGRPRRRATTTTSVSSGSKQSTTSDTSAQSYVGLTKKEAIAKAEADDATVAHPPRGRRDLPGHPGLRRGPHQLRDRQRQGHQSHLRLRGGTFSPRPLQASRRPWR